MLLRVAEGVTLEAPLAPDRTARSTIFRVDDCRAAYSELRALGARFLTEPVDHGYEIRAFFTDPDGHLFEISELVRPEDREDLSS